MVLTDKKLTFACTLMIISYIVTASVKLSLHYLLSLPMLLSALLTHSCIPCLVYTWLSSLLCLSSLLELLIPFYACLVNFSNIKLILSDRTHSTRFVVISHARYNKFKQQWNLILSLKAPFWSTQTELCWHSLPDGSKFSVVEKFRINSIIFKN